MAVPRPQRFFASCEQQENRALRGQPVIVAQTWTDSAVAIAASYAAQAFGIRTGTLVRDARQLCPGVIAVQAKSPALHRVSRAHPEGGRHLFAGRESVLDRRDGLQADGHRTAGAGRAGTGHEGEAGLARAGRRMPHLLDRHRHECVSRQGRVRPAEAGITKDDLPSILLGLELQNIYGIGPRMEQRLHRAGIVNVEQLWEATPFQLRRVWGGINGLLFHQMLHGVEIQPPSSRYSKSIGHQHVLEPDLRSKNGAHDFAQHLLTKAAERLRRGDYSCRRLGVHLSWIADLGGWWDETDFHETRDTGFLLARLEELWKRVPHYKPLSVGVVLLDLVPADHHQPDLFAVDNHRRQKLSPLIDRINDRYGRCSIGFGLFPPDVRAFKGHVAFHRVPERWEF
jgi:DNA polymerase IV